MTASSSTMLAPKFNNVPEVLKDRDSWLLWRSKRGFKADGTPTVIKMPFYADGTRRKGALGTKQDRAKLVSFDEAKKAFRAGNGRWAGIGFATMADYPITILDLDSVVDDDGEIDSEFAMQVLETGTYVELSPSGHGLRAVFSGEAVCKGKRNGRIENGERIEIYCGSAFVTITGHRLEDAGEEAKKLPKRIKAALQPVVEGGGREEGSRVEVDGDVVLPVDAKLPHFSVDHARRVLEKLPANWGSPESGTWYKVAGALHLQFDGSDEAYEVLDEWSQGLDGYDPEANRRNWNRNWAHDSGKSNITTMRNLVFESVLNGGLDVKEATMRRWGLKRTAQEDFGEDDDPDIENETAWPEIGQMEQLADIGEMLRRKPDPIEWVIEDLLPRGVVTTLAGGSGTAKSFLVQQMCAAGAVGLDEFAGMKIQEGGFCSLYLAFEDTRKMLHQRVHKLKYRYASIGGGDSELDDKFEDIEIDDDAIEQMHNNMLMLTTEVLDSGDWQFVKKNKKFDAVKVTGLHDHLRQFISHRKVDLLIIDTGSEAHSADENNAQEMVVLMRTLRQLSEGSNIAVLVVQHIPKTGIGKRIAEIDQALIRGSSVLVDKSRNVVVLTKLPRDDAPMYGVPKEEYKGYVILTHVKANLGPIVEDKVFVRDDKGLLDYRPNLKKLDPEMLREVEVEEKQERTAAIRKAKIEAAINSALEFVQARNDAGWSVSNNEIKEHLHRVGTASQDLAKEIPQMLLSEKLCVSKRTVKNQKANLRLVVTDHALLKKSDKYTGKNTRTEKGGVEDI